MTSTAAEIPSQFVLTCLSENSNCLSALIMFKFNKKSQIYFVVTLIAQIVLTNPTEL